VSGGPSFFYKHGKKGGLSTEVAICIRTGGVLRFKDHIQQALAFTISLSSRDSLMTHLDDGERVGKRMATGGAPSH
jgi:hypothetical protein